VPQPHAASPPRPRSGRSTTTSRWTGLSVLRFIPDPNFPGSRVEKIPDPGSGSASKILSMFNPKIGVSKLWEI
jgi:hypothetical protein